MPKLRGIKLNKIKKVFENLPNSLAERAFSTFFGFLVILLILGAIIFYQYGILAERKISESPEEPLKFEEKTYQKVLDEWQERNEKLLQINSKEYPDLFQALTE